MSSHRPEIEIARGNDWYLADQFRSQLGTRGRRRVVENRWRVFGRTIHDWASRRGHVGALTVLDAGCGDGINLVGLTEMSEREGPALTLLGVDYNSVRLTRARRVAPAALSHAALFQLPFISDSIDVALCNHVLEHVPELAAALAELRRVLRPGGLLIIGVPNEGCGFAWLRNRVLQPAIARTTDHVHFFTERTLRAAVRGAGFTDGAIERETFFFPCSYLNMCCNEFHAGHWLMAMMRRLFPSQAGGLILACEKP